MSMHFLDQEIRFLKGVGGNRADVLGEIGVRHVRDLFWYFPRRYLDRSTITPIRSLREDVASATVVGTVEVAGIVPGRRSRRFELHVLDESGARMKCVWFQGVSWIARLFKDGERVAFHGRPQRYGSTFTMSHPDFDKLDADGPALDTGRIISLYPGGAALSRVGLNSRSFRHVLYDLFKESGLKIPEVLPDWIRKERGLMDGRVALRAVHFPRSHEELQRARKRLKFEELFFIQLMLAMMRRSRGEDPGAVFGPPGTYVRTFIDEVLPFSLTDGQEQAIEDVVRDTRSGERMSRLIQGDVGSGKTVVAVGAILHALDSGYQSAFMAPTEILAEQHYANLSRYFEPLGVEARLLVGGLPKREREAVLADLAEGRVHVAVGTHALLEADVAFHRFGLAVIDEQHRFGVAQRARIYTKGTRPHMLLMTATPIPRSLAMTLYGDLDVSLIRERPAGRKPVRTAVRYEKERDEVYRFMRAQIEGGRQCYVVYPLVEESEKLDLKDAESGFEKLASVFAPHRVDLVHGRVPAEEKAAAMSRFKRGETAVLVATTVVEVGVDVPNATIMLVEHAERFGLSQLHQLRGRVGRGADQSYCILLADYRRTAEARERLEAMVRTEDGFEISEIDLKLRGAGDFFGTKQSGLPDLKIADLAQDTELLAAARDAVAALVEQDPELDDPAHRVLRDYFDRFYARQSMGFARIG